MPTRDQWLKQPLRQRLERMARTADEITGVIHHKSDAELSRRPDTKYWAAKELVCHLRDIEELVILRFHMMLAMDDPKVLVVGAPLAWDRGSLHPAHGRVTFKNWTRASPPTVTTIWPS